MNTAADQPSPFFYLTLVHLHDQTADLLPLLPHLLPWKPIVQAYRQLKVHHWVLQRQADISVQENHATVRLNISFLSVNMGSGARVYLKEALGILQQIQTAVAAVVLLRNSAVGAPHVVLCKETRGPPADLPLYLQVAEQRTSTNRQLMIKHPSNSTAEGESYQKRWQVKPVLNEFWTVTLFFFKNKLAWRSRTLLLSERQMR